MQEWRSVFKYLAHIKVWPSHEPVCNASAVDRNKIAGALAGPITGPMRDLVSRECEFGNRRHSKSSSGPWACIILYNSFSLRISQRINNKR